MPKTSVLILVAGQNPQEIIAAAIFKQEFPSRIVQEPCAAVNQLSQSQNSSKDILFTVVTSVSASLFQFSFLISRLQQDNTLTANPHIPVHKNIAAMPLPAAFPTITPNIPANPFPELINGSNT